jgi:hypothetical protein
MQSQFGFNCKQFLPTLDKCRTLINQYGCRKELVVQRWLHTREIMPYLNLSQEELLRRVASGELKSTVQKDRKLKFCVSGAFEFDDCFLAKSGGQCLYFEPRCGTTISCIAERDGLDAEHPNAKDVPTNAEIRTLEDEVIRLIGVNASTETLLVP